MKLKKTIFKRDNILLLSSIILIILTLSYFSTGFYDLTINQNTAVDLFSRWQEQQYIYRGLYPYDAMKGSPNVIPEIGTINSGGYPPWAFFTGFIFFPPISWELTRFYHLILNVLSILVLAVFVYQIAFPYGKPKALFTLTACLALSSHKSTLAMGQYGIIINALLIIMFWLIQRNKNVWAGLIFAVAMVKPNISAPYFLVLVIQKRIKAIVAFSLYIVFGSINIWIITKLTPIYMLDKIFGQSKYFADKGYSAIGFVTALGFDPKQATVFIGIIGILAIAILVYLCRYYSLLNLFAICCVIGRVFVYHRHYDNLMLVFLLLAITKITFERENKLNILFLSLVALSLWVPARIIDYANFEVVQIIIWIAALGHILIQGKQKVENSIRSH
ncbi:MAG: glycosyltransferase family 87 protein [Rivularia sp. (in: cyanobacteria)]